MDDPASFALAILDDGAQHSRTVITIFARLFAVLFFVVANGFFVGAEFALVSVRRTRLETRAAAGSRRAQAALRLINNPSFFISATQLGITIASLALGWVGEPTIAALLEPIAAAIAPPGRAAYIAHLLAIVIAFAAITFLHIVLGELMPKMFALERAEALALIVARPLELFAKVFRPFIFVFNRTGQALARVLGFEASLQHAAVYSEAELRQLVDISRESGHLRAEERRLIHRVFEFSDTLVRDAMVPRPAIAGLSASCTLEDINQAFQQHRYSRLPVYRDSLDNVIGFIHSKDLIPYLLRPQDFKLEYVLQPDRKSTRLNSSHLVISYAVFCLKKKNRPPLEFSLLHSRSLQYSAILFTAISRRGYGFSRLCGSSTAAKYDCRLRMIAYCVQRAS